MINITIEIELDGVITVKQLKMPLELKHDFVKANQYVRNYYQELSYNVGKYIRIC
ncbi:hypothetical protein G9F71_008455 [Clostridium sp. FP2]|uniref:hypothetical protein n=1 Tax=Clostridium sp. FP2 TaxID=2724481 RepID=UPI0013E90C5F|nr:hypothetical protein [Clostridium sp. FP2]MBZ9622883.1 hypothetical protein [Clostridium sp. FP2]